jgi:hypothetical protein
MTRNEAEQFFDKVIGKKIVYHSPSSTHPSYFIPDCLNFICSFNLPILGGFLQNGVRAIFAIGGGFVKEDKSDNTYWTFHESESEPSILDKCTCGAKHTSSPNHHLSYCDLKDNL